MEAATSAMADALRLLLRTEGLDMDRERISLRTVGSGRLRLDASARFKWKFLRPRFRLRTTLRFGNRNAVRIVGTKITSSNLLFHMPLMLFRPRINKELRQAFDLDDAIAPWSIRDLRVRAGRRLDVDVQLTRPGH
ncbi:MAG: hypothetical protein GX596_14985 [Propionibacterium sp.]|nr:hypothetical protein [Propionibacterium sp.]